MTFSMGGLRQCLLGISLDEVRFSRRGFAARDDGARERLELVGATFVEGYELALAKRDPGALALRLNDNEVARHSRFRSRFCSITATTCAIHTSPTGSCATTSRCSTATTTSAA